MDHDLLTGIDCLLDTCGGGGDAWERCMGCQPCQAWIEECLCRLKRDAAIDQHHRNNKVKAELIA